MRRRTLLVAVAGLAVVVVAGVVVLWPQPPSRITQENCDRIKEGMSRAEVETILGPPGDYRTRLGETLCLDGWGADLADPGPTVSTWQPFFEGMSGAVWKGDSIEILIVCGDYSGRVVRKEVYERRVTGNAIDNLVWRAKRQWHRWFPE
jgi:hypothetical protein